MHVGDEFSRNELRRVKGKEMFNHSDGISVLPNNSKSLGELVMVIGLSGAQFGPQRHTSVHHENDYTPNWTTRSLITN